MFVDSSWYFMRYLPNAETMVDEGRAGTDGQYISGIERASCLLYASDRACATSAEDLEAVQTCSPGMVLNHIFSRRSQGSISTCTR